MHFIKLIRTVLWSFLGIRKRSGLEADLKAARPVHLILAALIIAAIFIAILLALVMSALHLAR